VVCFFVYLHKIMAVKFQTVLRNHYLFIYQRNVDVIWNALPVLLNYKIYENKIPLSVPSMLTT
jgi:hypothetical protein